MLPTDLDPIDDICSRGIVKDGDIARLRRTVYGSHGIATADIETLFRINKTTRVQDPAWAPFFIEAVTDYIVNELPPQGYVTADNARWLVGQISKDGRIANAAELELLVNVLDQARWVPESLARLALDQVVLAVTSGTGPLRDGRRLAPGHVTVDDVTLLRRVLYAFGGDGSAAVTRSEAEALLAIEEATADGSQAPEWQELFVKAIAGAMMASSGYKVPAREEALRREQWLLQRGDLSIGNFIGRILAGCEIQTAQERALARLERQRIEIITSEPVSEGEAAWLAERIARDGHITANEKLLLAFIRQETRGIHPALQRLADEAAKAA
jgi:hypothetical protein